MLLFAEQAGKQTGSFRVVGVALALLRLRNASHYLGYVLAAARPGWLATFATGGFLTHGFSLS